MPSFNDLLVINGIDPREVALLRHSGTGRLGLTPFDLWDRHDGSFERYQSTQAPGRPIFERSPYWASFVSNAANATIFVGLYSARKGDNSQIAWTCPLDGDRPGERRGHLSDLYETELIDQLADQIGSLSVDWGDGNVAWIRYAARNPLPLAGEIDLGPVLLFADTAEGVSRWVEQKTLERSSRLATQVLQRNHRENCEAYRCEACEFEHSDRAMFDVHHLHPLCAGPRITRSRDLAVLCPTCHRRAHRSAHRMVPFTIAELRNWSALGRP